jgi:hypothetical protein
MDASSKCLGLAVICQRGVKVNTAVEREGKPQASSSSSPPSMGLHSGASVYCIKFAWQMRYI